MLGFLARWLIAVVLALYGILTAWILVWTTIFMEVL